MQYALYTAIVILYFCAAGVDLIDKEYKAALVAALFGVVNGIIFLWRP